MGQKTSSSSLGEDLRALRISRKMTLEDLATQMSRSVGWLSQVERDISVPKIEDLKTFAQILDVPLSLFFGTSDAPENEKGRIVRASARRIIGDYENGVLETLISPDLTDSFEMIHSIFHPHSLSNGEISRPTQEVAYLASGTLELWLEDEKFTIHAGDSFRIRGESYRWANPSDEPAIAIWVISPPVY